MKNIEGRVMVITGAASGIGRALAIRAAAGKTRLTLVDRDAAGLARTAEQCHEAPDIKILRVDVTHREEVEAAARDVVAHFGCVDIVVNNAGVSSSGLIQELTYETLQWTIDTNFWGMVHGTKAFLPHLLARSQANLVNISSVYGLIGVPAQAAYCASKFAVRGFTEAVRQDLCGTSIAVTIVFPGGVRTQIVRNSRTDSSLPLAAQERIRQRIEASFRNSPEDAAEAILRGIRRNAPRVLIGAEARTIDLLARLRPESYDSVVARHAARLYS